ncbi:MAG: hypothetical protein N2554_03720 [Fimbriimonadales bacterium]|nr:hypothetical protein [Fimbriimonadales bacterium]
MLQGEAFYAQAVSNRITRLFRPAYRRPEILAPPIYLLETASLVESPHREGCDQ